MVPATSGRRRRESRSQRLGSGANPGSTRSPVLRCGDCGRHAERTRRSGRTAVLHRVVPPRVVPPRGLIGRSRIGDDPKLDCRHCRRFGQPRRWTDPSRPNGHGSRTARRGRSVVPSGLLPFRHRGHRQRGSRFSGRGRSYGLVMIHGWSRSANRRSAENRRIGCRCRCYRRAPTSYRCLGYRCLGYRWRGCPDGRADGRPVGNPIVRRGLRCVRTVNCGQWTLRWGRKNCGPDDHRRSDRTSHPD
jgi:hypothetical protein